MGCASAALAALITFDKLQPPETITYHGGGSLKATEASTLAHGSPHINGAIKAGYLPVHQGYNSEFIGGNSRTELVPCEDVASAESCEALATSLLDAEPLTSELEEVFMQAQEGFPEESSHALSVDNRYGNIDTIYDTAVRCRISATHNIPEDSELTRQMVNQIPEELSTTIGQRTELEAAHPHDNEGYVASFSCQPRGTGLVHTYSE